MVIALGRGGGAVPFPIVEEEEDIEPSCVSTGRVDSSSVTALDALWRDDSTPLSDTLLGP